MDPLNLLTAVAYRVYNCLVNKHNVHGLTYKKTVKSASKRKNQSSWPRNQIQLATSVRGAGASSCKQNLWFTITITFQQFSFKIDNFIGTFPSFFVLQIHKKNTTFSKNTKQDKLLNMIIFVFKPSEMVQVHSCILHGSFGIFARSAIILQLGASNHLLAITRVVQKWYPNGFCKTDSNIDIGFRSKKWWRESSTYLYVWYFAVF